MSKKNRKISLKDLRKHIISTKKVDGGKIHTISTPNAGNIEIVEGNKHSKGGVNYIKTSDGVTHEIENNEVVLDTDKGPYVVSDYMNTDGSKNYNKNKTSYADLVKHLAMGGASKQDLEAVAMQTEIANGNNPNNPSSLIKDTNSYQQPEGNLEYKEPVSMYKKPNTALQNLLALKQMNLMNSQNAQRGPQQNINPMNSPNSYIQSDNSFGNMGVTANMGESMSYKEPIQKYQQITDSQGNMLVPNRKSSPNDNMLQRTGKYIGNKYLQAVGRNDEYYQEPVHPDLKYHPNFPRTGGEEKSGTGHTIEDYQNAITRDSTTVVKNAEDSWLYNNFGNTNSTHASSAGTAAGNLQLNREWMHKLKGYTNQDTKNSATKLNTTEKYQQTDDRQSKDGKDNLMGNLFGQKRTEVEIGGDDVRLEDEGSLINNQNIEYNISDGDTTGVNQNLYTNQIGNRTDAEGNVIETTDNLQYNIVNGELVITDKSGKVHNNVTQVSEANRPSLFRKDLKGGNQVVTNTSTSGSPAWPHGNINITQTNGEYELDAASVNSFRSWMNANVPDFEYDGEKLDATGGNNKYVKRALELHGDQFTADLNEGNYNRNSDGSFKSEAAEAKTETIKEDVSREEINTLLKKKYQDPYKYKGGGHLKRMYQEPDVEHSTSFEGDETTIGNDFMFDYDENLIPITENDNTYGNYPQTNWTHADDSTKNVQPTQAEMNEKGFNNVQEWRNWVNTQKGFEGYDWGKTEFWGPKHQEAWKKMSGPPINLEDATVSGDESSSSEPCVGPNCGPSEFSSNAKIDGTKRNKLDTEGGGSKIPWKGIGIAALGAGAIYGLSKLGGGNSAVDEAMKAKANLIPHISIPEARLKLMNNDNELAMLDRERWSAMKNLKKGYNPTGTYMNKGYEVSEETSAKKSTSYSNLNMTNAKIGNQEAGLNTQINMKEADINAKIDVSNQLERRDIREQRIAALDAKHNRRMSLVRDLIKLGGQGLEAYATSKSKNTPLTKGQQ